jgi:hypothetical protein
MGRLNAKKGKRAFLRKKPIDKPIKTKKCKTRMREAERRKKKVMDKRGRDAKMAAAAQPQSRPTSTRPLPPPPPLQSRAPPPNLARPRFEPVDREKVSLSLSFLLDLFTANSNLEFTMTLWIVLTSLYRSLLISFFCVKKNADLPSVAPSFH